MELSRNTLLGLSEIKIDMLIDKLEVVDRSEASNLMLSWNEISIMHDNGISFGSHTVTHPILSRLSLEMAREEINISKRTIEKTLGATVKSFAYPSGRKIDFNESVKELLKEAGYTSAVTMIFGSNEHGHDLFELHREDTWEVDLATFATCHCARTSA